MRRDGSVEHGRPLWEVGAHVKGHNVKGHNKYIIGICYEGGLDSAGQPADTRTPQQVKVLRELVERFHAYFPDAIIVGHQDLDPKKSCPCYSPIKEYKDLQPR